MGAEWSSEDQAVIEDIETQVNQQAEAGSQIKLYKFIRTDSVRRWQLVSENARPSFYDANEDSETETKLWHLEISSGEIDGRVDHSVDFRANLAETRVVFSLDDVWCLKFPGAAAFSAFCKEFNNRLFENTFQVENTEENRKMLFGKEFAERLYTEGGKEDMDWEAAEGGDYKPTKKPKSRTFEKEGAAISGVTMGVGDNSYLLRGGQIDVLKNEFEGFEDKDVSFEVSVAGGDALEPSTLLLANNETKMNILSPMKRTSVLHADIETGKVVSEWCFEKNGVEVPMADIVTEAKGAQIDDRSTFLGFDKNRLCRWDMRDPDGVVQTVDASGNALDFLSGKDYSRGTNFACMATSGDGSVVVGAKDGKVRLYSNKLTLTRAATSFPALGVPITAVDVTFDGNWVVATTDNFLQVLKTTCKDKTGKEISGYKKSMGANQPSPKLLKLKAEDKALVGKKPFRNGKFTFVTESDRHERWIVASCGNYTILWNFRTVKISGADTVSAGGLATVTSYHMLNRSEQVVDSCFMHDSYMGRRADPSLVVATSNRVYSTFGDDE